MTRRRLREALALAMLAAAIGPPTAAAYFSAGGSGAGSAQLDSLLAPSLATPRVSGGAVELSWSAVSAPGSGPVTYSVSRDGAAPTGNCPTASAPNEVTSCTDSGLHPGTYSFEVTAHWRGWSAVSDRQSANVTAGSATRLALTAATSAPTVGEADALTLVAEAADGTADSHYEGVHEITFSGAAAGPSGQLPTVTDRNGVAVPFGAPTPLEFDAGVASVAGSANGAMRLYASGATKVGATDGALATVKASNFDVAPGPAAGLGLATAASALVAGTAEALTVNALDAYGNVAVDYSGTHRVTFSGAMESPGGTAPTVTNSAGKSIAFGAATKLKFTEGSASPTGAKNGSLTLTLAEPTSLGATDGELSTASALVLEVAAGQPGKLAFDDLTTAGSVEPGCLFTCTVTGVGNGGTIASSVAVTDEFGNLVADLGSGHAVSVDANRGTIVGGELTIAPVGAAVSTGGFTYTTPSKGKKFKLTAATSAGEQYGEASLQATR